MDEVGVDQSKELAKPLTTEVVEAAAVVFIHLTRGSGISTGSLGEECAVVLVDLVADDSDLVEALARRVVESRSRRGHSGALELRL